MADSMSEGCDNWIHRKRGKGVVVFWEKKEQ